MRKQLAIYRDLGVPDSNLEGVFKVVGEPPALPAVAAPEAAPPPRVLLFAGHMIDAPGRGKPRFPAAKEAVAREDQGGRRERAAGAGGVAGGTGDLVDNSGFQREQLTTEAQRHG